jgi:hypothetical protein
MAIQRKRESIMETGPSTFDWDILVAAVLTVPVIEPGAPAEERIERFRATLQELRRQGGARKISPSGETG